MSCQKHVETTLWCYDCQAQIKKLEHYNKNKVDAGIKKSFFDANFENYVVKNDKQKIILQKLSEFNFIAYRNIVLIGKTGTGKTHLGISLINKSILGGLKARYIKFYELVDIKIHAYPDFKRLSSIDVLVIDEYGRSKSDYHSEMLFNLIDQRYDDNLITMIISNLDTQSFKDSLSDALYSRLKESCLFHVCDWKDYRLGDNK